MKAEQLHDVLNQLPDDLIAGTDALRQAKKQPLVVWKRLVPLAACFALVLAALYVTLPYLGRKSASQESMVMQDEVLSEMAVAGQPATRAPGAAAGEPESPMEAAPESEEDRNYDEVGAPMAPGMEDNAESTTASETPVMCRTFCIGAEEPDEIQITVISTEKEWAAYLADHAMLMDAENFENRYDDAYFETHQLIAVVTAAASSSVTYQVDAIQRTGMGSWELTGTRYCPEWFTDDMTQQLLLIELPRMVEPEDTVTWSLETETR